MSTMINIKLGSCRTINYTGDIKHLGDTLAEETKDDRELEQQILFAANEIGMIQYIKENNDHYLGDVPSKINGEQGGPIGGRMVKKMIEAERNKMN